jgi:choline-sulfatase
VNVLLVMADQLVPFLTGAYGHPVVRTPHLDRLAREGLVFDAAYTPYPLCSPARAALLTGRHASDLGCWDNASELHADEPTVAHHLTNAGYETVLSGKMHFVGPDQLHGFRRRLTTDVYPASMDWVPSQDEEGRFVRGGHAKMYVPPRVGVAPWTQFLSYDEETQFRGLEYLRERARTGSDEPFFLVVSFHHPHDPFVVTQELWDLYEGAEIELPARPEHIDLTAMDHWANEAHETDTVDLDDPAALRALRRAYYGLVTYVDRKLGELLGALERAGERVARPVSLLDLAPTLLDLAGVPAPDRLPLDGTSLLGDEERTVFSEYHVEKVRAPCFMARRGRWKLIELHGHDRRLFDLDADPGEWTDQPFFDATRQYVR